MGLKPVKVSQLNSYIKRILQTDPILGNISVVGEVSNLKFHGSGHVYFSLKDEKSRINCFLPSERADKITCALQEGTEVIAHGYIYLYERGGSYSLNVKDIEAAGQGELAAAFEKLKQKLSVEGLFDPMHKKPIPAFPRKVAVVTSETGAAVRDILKIIQKKNDCVDVLIYPVLVQGPEAAREIAEAIRDLNENHPDVDTIITGRGGGSMEELWAFNEEIVARSIYESQIPVISAVGHETDFTIADFAADLRAETPTAAADAAVPDTKALKEALTAYREDLNRSLEHLLENRRRRLALCSMETFERDIRSRIAMEQMRADHITEQMKQLLQTKAESCRSRLELLRETVEAANPERILQKGYTILTDENGHVIHDVAGLKKDQNVRLKGAGGFAEAKILSAGKKTEKR